MEETNVRDALPRDRWTRCPRSRGLFGHPHDQQIDGVVEALGLAVHAQARLAPDGLGQVLALVTADSFGAAAARHSGWQPTVVDGAYARRGWVRDVCRPELERAEG